MAITDQDRKNTEQIMSRLSALTELADRIRSRELFGLFEVETLDELEDLKVPPPAYVYVREVGNYYFMYPYSSDLAETPYHSVIGKGWHNMDSPTPRYDRKMHTIHTQWLNGWNLDYFPDYIDTSQGGWELKYMNVIFGQHFGPPNKDSVLPIPNQYVLTDGDAAEGSNTLYLTDLKYAVNSFCTLTVAGNTYSLIEWDQNNDPPLWVKVTPDLTQDIPDESLVVIEYPEVSPSYEGQLAQAASAGDTTIIINGLTGPIDTSYILAISGGLYQILDYQPQGNGKIPYELTISPGLASDLDAQTPWSMLKTQGKYNTEIPNMQPGDLIFRAQQWNGTINGNHSAGDTTINIVGVETEIASRWHDSNNLPQNNADLFDKAMKGSVLIVEGEEYEITDHFPNGRSEVDERNNSKSPRYNPSDFNKNPWDTIYPNDRETDSDAWTGPNFDNTRWKPTGLPTTKIRLRKGLKQSLSDGTEFIIQNKHYYIVSVEHLGSDEPVDWMSPRFCEGHKRECFDFFHLATGDQPSRFEMMLHVIANEEAFDDMFNAGKIIPGDLAYHERWHNWYQVLPVYHGGNLKEDEVSFGDFSRTLTVHDRDEFDWFAQDFELNNLWVVNNTHGSQSMTRQIITGFDADGNLTYRDWTRYQYHPAEFVYYPGVAEPSVR